MLVKRSPLHVPQPPGRYYSREAVAGYYNDLRAKVTSCRLTDQDGLPMNELVTGEKIIFPTTVAQYGLGCWDLFLETGNNEYWRGAETAARWLLEHVDSRGGWDASAGLQQGYSAMTQGEAASLLIRVGIRTKDHNYICVAERALELLLQKREDGGTARQEGLDMFLEEDPTGKYPGILNGWVFALFGLFDGAIATKRVDFREAFNRGCDTLVRNIERYDAGFWSYYDLAGHLVSPFYHVLHIAQLTVLGDLTGRKELTAVAERWSAYKRSVPGLLKAVAIKAVQKLREPSDVIVVR